MNKYMHSLIAFCLLCFAPAPVFAKLLVIETEVTCDTPTTQPTNLTFVNTFSDYTFASFTPTSADGYLKVVSTTATLSTFPVNGTSYSDGDLLGSAKVVGTSFSNSFPVYGLNPNTTYYFFIFAYNNIGCGTGIRYNTSLPLSATITTTIASPDLPVTQPTNLLFNTYRVRQFQVRLQL
jgi:hypothetical protein